VGLWIPVTKLKITCVRCRLHSATQLLVRRQSGAWAVAQYTLQPIAKQAAPPAQRSTYARQALLGGRSRGALPCAAGLCPRVPFPRRTVIPLPASPSSVAAGQIGEQHPGSKRALVRLCSPLRALRLPARERLLCSRLWPGFGPHSQIGPRPRPAVRSQASLRSSLHHARPVPACPLHPVHPLTLCVLAWARESTRQGLEHLHGPNSIEVPVGC
jgi:hypothetical protein